MAVEYLIVVVFPLGDDVDTTAIGGYPDVALGIFQRLIGAVRGQRILVVVMMAEIDNGVAARSVRRHLVDAVVLVAEPVVALLVLADMVETAERLTVTVLMDGLAVAMLVDKEERSFLVTY